MVIRLMRVLLAFLAILSLLASPAVATAAQAICSHGGATAMAGMAMPTVGGSRTMDATEASGALCCDPAHHHGKAAYSGCAQGCAAACAALAALPPSPLSGAQIFAQAPRNPARLAPVHEFRPSGPRRPPKSIV
jgi:hypothetical protein